MTQLSFQFPQRFEIGPTLTSWWDGDHAVYQFIGAHCVDLSWPWLTFPKREYC